MGPVQIEDIGMDGKSWDPALAAGGVWQAFAAWPLPLQWCFVGLFGLVIGSFLTVVIHRLPIMMARAWDAEREADLAANAGASDASDALDQPAPALPVAARFDLVLPRSHCPHCGHTLTWYENLPLIGYVLARGRCRACGTRIGVFYPAIEAATMALACAVFWRYGVHWQALAGFGLLGALLVLACIDARTQFLPDIITLPLVWLGLLLNLPVWSPAWQGAAASGLYGGIGADNSAHIAGMLPGTLGDASSAVAGAWLADPGAALAARVGLFCPLPDAVIGAAAGYGFLWIVYWGFRLVRGKEGIGYGDFKLLAALGAWFGWPALPQIILIAALGGSIVGVIALTRGHVARDEPLPFGPYLAAAGAVTLLFGDLLTSLLAPWLTGA
jgi:leader peptidase (prepilin peptidase)/N-methyltransferase